MKSERVTLYYNKGNSDKMYDASLEEASDNSFTVNFAYGRRGDTLKTGTKTQSPIEYTKAKKIFDKLINSKTSKGYTVGEGGVEYVNTDVESRDTGVQCQLLNFIEESEVDRLINDDSWWAQEKYDGRRMLILKNSDTTVAINRRGLIVGAPRVILDSARSNSSVYLIDGEAVGEELFAFDMLEYGNIDLRQLQYSERFSILKSLGFGHPINVVSTAKTKVEKQQLYDRLKESGTEGIVFKKHSSPYTAGRPNSKGDHVKFKFYNTASVIVTKINNKRSVAISVTTEEGQVSVGNATIPPNKEIPEVNSIIEVRYLYAYRGGSLFQPTYLGVRSDINFEDCDVSQLKYKNKI
ncbi:MAG: WGR domain-containing protein [bacterium]|nr:WGR domain-containing protein [bacterium]